MKVVYDLVSDLAANLERVVKTQAMTLIKQKPLLVLRGAHGLFASPVWWANLEKGLIATEVRVGTIERLFFAGQNACWGDDVNSFVLRGDDGSFSNESIIVNQKAFHRLFPVGARVQLRYAFDELKRQPAPDGGVNYARVLLEASIA